MFGIELPTDILSACKDAGNSGYLVNNKGKPLFSSTQPAENTIAILKINDTNDLSVPENVRAEMNKYNLAYTVIGTTKDKSKSYFPDRYFEKVAYENRIYVYGVLDCYTLIRDYFRDKYDVWIPANIDRAFGWWHNGRNLYVDLYSNYGFKEVFDPIRKDDVLLFKFDNGMPSHSAIYIGGGKMLHHMIGRFSCIDDFDGIYKTSLAGVLRYNGSME